MIFILSTVYALKFFSRNLCSGLINVDFDSQNFFTWIYTAIKGYQPYRDISYAYGLLMYHNADNLFVHFLYIMQIPLLTVGMWWFINQLFRKQIVLKYLLFIITILYLIVNTGPVSFTRYGLSLIVLMLACYWLCRERLSTFWLLLYGCFSALIISLVIDQGIYIVVVTVGLIIYRHALMVGKVNFLRVIVPKFLFTMLIYVTGIAIGLIPFIFYLEKSNSLAGFIEFVQQLGYMNIYIKNSFTSSLQRPANLWIFLCLAVSFAAITFKILYKRSKLNAFISYCQVAGVLVLSLFLQKDLLRTGMENQITFIGIFLWILILADFVAERKKPILWRYQLVLGLFIIFIFHLTTQSIPSPLIDIQILRTLYQQPADYAEVKRCTNQTIDPDRMEINTHYLKVFDAIKKINTQPMLFSFPGDPIFYILNNQKPAPYFNLYDASPLSAQKKNISYIEEARVDYVIFNTQIKAIQDNVPDIVRGNTEIRYLVTHFSPLMQVEQFLVLQRNDLFDKPPQIFSHDNIVKFPDFYNQLLNFGLGYIPRSEGRAKWPILEKQNPRMIIQAGNEAEFNNQLNKVQGDIVKMILLITPKGSNGISTSLSLYPDEGPATTITYLACKDNKVCLVNLDNIPIFMQKSKLKSIHFSEPFSGILQLIDVNDTRGILW
jgi:hypothetical protein